MFYLERGRSLNGEITLIDLLLGWVIFMHGLLMMGVNYRIRANSVLRRTSEEDNDGKRNSSHEEKREISKDMRKSE